MSDRSSLTLLLDVKSLSDGCLTAVRDALDGWVGAHEEDGERFFWEEVSLGTIDDLVEQLTKVLDEHDEDVAYDAWQDPKYEFMGRVVRHRPCQADFVGDCDANGTTRVPEHQLRGLMDHEDIHAALDELCGPEGFYGYLERRKTADGQTEEMREVHTDLPLFAVTRVESAHVYARNEDEAIEDSIGAYDSLVWETTSITTERLR